jgi:hypothetical protein
MKISDSDFQTGPGLRFTTGEILSDGSVVEPVLAASGNKLELLLFDGKTGTIAPQFSCDGVTWHAPHVPPSLLRAIAFPRGITEYGKRLQLFQKIAGVFERYAGVPTAEASFLAYVVKCALVPECDPGPKTFCVTGGDAALRQRLCRLLHVFCRRPFVTAELNRRLPFWLHPTLILTNPRLSAQAVAFWRASNSPGVYVLESRGEVCNIACARIIFCESAESQAGWGPEALSIHLPPAGLLPPFTRREEEALTDECQQQLLLLRLEVLLWKEPSNPAPERDSSQLTSSGVHRHLPLFLQREPEIVKAVSPLLEAHEEELKLLRRLDPDLVLRELLWESAHTEKEISTEALTQHLNAELRNRGETLVFNEREIGWKLTKLGLPRRDNGHNHVLRFSRVVIRRVHRLAAESGLQLARVAGCPDCQDP